MECFGKDYTIVFRSPSPQDVYTYTPGLAVLPGGRLIATFDLGGKGAANLPNAALDAPQKIVGKAFLSDDHGATWRHVTDFPFLHARPFVAGDSLYILGHNGDLKVIRSDDRGETWSPVSSLTQGQIWHQSACNVWYKGDFVYLVMERRPKRPDFTGWAVAIIYPVLMRANIHDDLLKPESWTYASEMTFEDAVDLSQTEYFGIPMYNVPRNEPLLLAPGRNCAPFGWLETNVVQILPENHIWHDPTGHTFHLFARAHTGHTNLGIVFKVVEKPDGSMETMLETAPSGKKWLYLPLPGGQMRFHMLYDGQSKTYWLLSSQSTDSTILPERMPADRFGLPDNERHRLQLHFSLNCVDWCFAGMVDIGETPRCSRHYASLAVDGDNLLVLSRSGDLDAKDAHNGNIITFHTIRNFRGLIY